eukprot:365561-Chlamydomonas_euryale.AAC.4
MDVLDAVVAHDVEDAHADVVAVASAARQPRQREACVQPAQHVLPTLDLLCHVLRHRLLHVRNVLGLVVVVLVPWQHALARQPQPCEDERHALRARHARGVEHFEHKTQAVEEAPVRVLRLGDQDLGHERRLVRLAQHDREVVATVDPLLLPLQLA